MSNKEEMEEVSMETLLEEVQDKVSVFDRDSSGRWVYNSGLSSGTNTYSTEYNTTYMYDTSTSTWQKTVVQP